MSVIRDLLALSHQLVDSDSAALDTELLLAHCLGKDRTYLYTWPECEAAADTEKRFRELFERRRRGEPIAYLVGHRDFWSLSLTVDNSTLIPRPDTERLIEVALELFDRECAAVLDLGTGTGAIALALAKERPRWRVVGTDIAGAAVALAQRNARDLNIGNAEFLQSDWFDNIAPARFDLIVSNPPYIDADDPHLTRGDVRFEPRRALVAEQHGLAAFARIAEQARDYLSAGGWLLFEHGYEQAPAVRAMLARHAFTSIETWRDWGGNERVSGGCLPAAHATSGDDLSGYDCSEKERKR